MYNQQQQALSSHSILSLNIKIQQFLVFYLFCYNKKSHINFDYDSRFTNLVIEGPTEQLLLFRKMFKDTLLQYKASEFNVGFSAAGVLNFIVGILADRPKIKYFDSKKIQKICQLPNVRLEIGKKVTYMVGPKIEVQQLLKDIAKFVVVAGVVAVGVGIQSIKSKQKTKINTKVIEDKKDKKDTDKLEQKIKQDKLEQNISKIQQNPYIQDHETKIKQIPIKYQQSIPPSAQKQQKIPLINPPQQNQKLKQQERIKLVDTVTGQEEQFMSYFQYMNKYSKLFKKNQTIISIQVGSDIGSSDGACQFIQKRILQSLKFNLGQFEFKKCQRKQKSILLYGTVPNQSYEKLVQQQIYKNFHNISVGTIKLKIKDRQFFNKIKQINQFKMFINDDQTKLIHIFPKNISPQKIIEFNLIIQELFRRYSVSGESTVKETVIKYANVSNDIKSKLQNYNLLTSTLINNSPSKISISLPQSLPNPNPNSSNPNPNHNPNPNPIPNSIPIPNLNPNSNPDKDPQKVPIPDPNINANNKPIANKIIKKEYKFSYLIGQELWKFVEEISDQYLQINVNFNAVSKFSGRVNYIHLFESNTFFVKGPQILMKSYCQKIQQKLKQLKQKQSVSCLQVSEQTSKTMILQSKNLKYFEKNSGKGVRIITNPQIVPLFQICQTKVITPNKRYQILGIRASDCDLFVENFSTILLFNLKKDFQFYRNSYKNIETVIEDKFYNIIGICQEDSKNTLIDFVKQSIQSYQTQKIPSHSSKIKVFIFGETNQLKLLQWSLVQVIDTLYDKFLQIFLVFRDQDENRLCGEGFPDRFKKWYTILRNDITFYNYEGVMAISKAQQASIKEIILNSDHLQYTGDTHCADLINKTFTHIKYGDVIQYKDCKDFIQFDYKGKNHILARNCYLQLRKAQQNKQDKINLSISLMHVDIEKKIQTNLWNGYNRELKYQELILSDRNLMLSNQCSKHIVHIVSENKKQHQKIHNGLDCHFCRKTCQNLELKGLKDRLKIDKLEKLCFSNNIEIIKLTENQLQIIFENGNIGLANIKKYIDMLNNQQYIVTFPKYWQNHPQNKNYTQYIIPTYIQQFKEIKKIFPYQINKLIRIQNINAFTRYFHEKKFLEKINNGKVIKQMFLFHGTRLMDPTLLIADKQITFNVNYSTDKNYMGRATYFAQRPEYSHNYRFKLTQTIGVMLICMVLVGDSQKCPRLYVNYLDTDFKDKEKTIRYESMTEFYDGSQIYTVYKNNRAYPLYKVQYKTK